MELKKILLISWIKTQVDESLFLYYGYLKWAKIVTFLRLQYCQDLNNIKYSKMVLIILENFERIMQLNEFDN